MPARKGLLAPQNTFLDTIATRFDGTHSNFVLGNAQVSSQHPIVYCSDGFCELTGFARAQIMQKSCNCSFLYGQKTLDEHKRAIKEALENKTELKLEVDFYSKDNIPFRCLLDIVPIKNEKREVVLFLASHKDITNDTKLLSEDGLNDVNNYNDPEAPQPNFERRRSRAVLYQLSGHYRSNKVNKLTNSVPEYKTTSLKKSRFVLSHYGTFKNCWDWMVLVSTIYVAVIVPYNASFDQADRPSMVFDVVVEVLFMLDIVLNFCTTFVSRKGEVVSDHKSIAFNYVRRWFLVDLLAALPFDVLYAFDVYSGEMVRHVHLLKLTRLLRLARVLQKMDRYYQHSAMILLLLMLSFAVVAHWLACAWFALAEEEQRLNGHDWDLGWIHTLAERLKVPFLNVTYSESYITALYFTCSSLTSVGFGNVSANTSMEKVFSILVMLVGALMHAAVFGNVTAIIQRMYSRRSLYQSKCRDLKDFLALHQIPKELKQRMQDYFQTTWSLNHGIDIHETLKEFPEELRGDVCLHLHREILQLPIFEAASPGCLKLLSLHISSNFCAPGEYLIHRGNALAYIYYLCTGSMEVVQDDIVIAILGKGDLVGSDIGMYLQPNGVGIATTGGVSAPTGGGGGGGGGGISIDVLIKSSCDVRALTYCNLKCLHIIGLVEVLRLYPEYQQQFAHDIKHDLSYNLREGYEAEAESDVNGGPSQTLPSISEDDENEDISLLSPSHMLLASPGRHAKIASRLEEQRYQDGGGVRLRGRGQDRAARSTFPSSDHRSSVDRLDNHVSSLHQDVATLSQEVRSAIQVLQELATSSAVGQPYYAHAPPTRSNPNLPHEMHHQVPPVPGQLHRSSSHPPGMYHWGEEPIVPIQPTGVGVVRSMSPPPFPVHFSRPAQSGAVLMNKATQTDFPVDILERFVVENPQRVLALLALMGIEIPRAYEMWHGASNSGPGAVSCRRRHAASAEDIWQVANRGGVVPAPTPVQVPTVPTSRSLQCIQPWS